MNYLSSTIKCIIIIVSRPIPVFPLGLIDLIVLVISSSTATLGNFFNRV